MASIRAIALKLLRECEANNHYPIPPLEGLEIILKQYERATQVKLYLI